MLHLRDHFIGLTVASVQSGFPCGKVVGLVINPDNLATELLTIQDPKGLAYLLPGDIRFITNDRLIIDAEEKLSEAEDLLRHQDVINRNFNPLGCKVITESRKRLGKVTNFAIEDSNWVIGKLYVAAGLFGNPLQQEQMIDHGDVVNIEGSTITVRDLENRAHKPLTIPLPKHTA